MESRGKYDKKNLLAEPVSQMFPCIACNDHKNILDSSTWVPAFLRKASANSWEVFDIDLNQMANGIEWEGDEGLDNLWGLYYKCPDDLYMRTFKSKEASCQDSAVSDKMTEHSPKEQHFSDDATTAATTVSSSITSLTPRTVDSSPADLLMKCNVDFQNALEKHREDILCLIRKCAATSGKPAIPEKMIGKVREANLATMKSINKKSLWHGGREITIKEIKKLGAQAKKEALIMFDAEILLAKKQHQISVPAAPKHWSPDLDPGWIIMQMSKDGNCFYRAVSDQLFHDEGAGHVIIRHQINNHI
jgi:hypothetical protein